MKRHEGRGTTVSLGRGTRKSELQRRSGFLSRCCRFVHRPGEAVVPRHSEAVVFCPSGSTGFTLVEILATFVLIAVILPVAMNGISMAAKLASQAKHRVEAATLAQQMLGELVLSGDYKDGDQDGDVTEENTEYSWHLEVLDWEEEVSMQQLDLSVTWNNASGVEDTVALSTLVYTGSEE